MNNREKLLKENQKVSTFIANWGKENPYNPQNLAEHNAKFKTDFNGFLNKSNFSKETLNLFIVN